MPKTKVATAEQPEPKTPRGLTLQSRCDATASGTEQAFVTFSRKDGATLDLCAHHGNQLEASLIGQGFQATEDRRHEVNKTPSPSASVMAETEDTKGLDEWD